MAREFNKKLHDIYLRKIQSVTVKALSNKVLDVRNTDPQTAAET
jgi:hypothetical protein